MNPYHEKYLGIKSVDKKSPAFLCPLFAYVVAKKIVNITHKSFFDEFEYKLGREYAKILCNVQKADSVTGGKAIKSAIEEFENFGFGRTKIILISANKILLKNEFSSIARQYKKSFESEGKNIDYLLCGIYSGILSSHLDKEIHIKETSCFAAGNKVCIFENASGFLNNYPKLSYFIEKIIKFHRLDSSFVNYPTPLIKKAFEQGHFTKKDGMIKLWGIYSVYFKFGFFAFSSHILSKLSKDVTDLYKYIGMVQSDIAVQFQKNQYGIKENKEVFNSLLEQLNLFGYGHGKIEFLGKKKLVLRFKNIILLKQCTSFMKNFEDPYIEGILVGMSSIFGENIGKIEMSKAKDDELLVKIEFKGKGNLYKKITDSIKSNRIKEVVNEKMKHKYYLSPE